MPMAKGLIEFKFMRDSTITKEKGEGGEIWRRKIVALSGSSLSPRMTKDVSNERRLTYKRRNKCVALFVMVLIGQEYTQIKQHICFFLCRTMELMTDNQRHV